MIKKLASILGLILSVACFHSNASEFAPYGRSHSHIVGNKNGNQDFRNKHNYPEKNRNPDENQQGDPQVSAGDSKIVSAIQAKRRLDFVEGSGMVVIQLLPDDTSGLQHQKWIVRLSNGATMEAVYNIDMCERVPLQIGDKVSMGGQFIWTNQGALLHWLHYDPRQNRTDGYVELNGKVYCGSGNRHN